MLAIRMQRTGRSGHAQFRVIVQDRRFSPKSGRVVAYVGNYDPHSKAATLDKDKIGQYLSTGAQPSDRVARLLQKEGVKLPDWVRLEVNKEQAIKHPEKMRKNRPADAEPVEAPADAEAPATEPATESPVEEAPEATAAETPVTEAEDVTEAPAEESVEAAAEEIPAEEQLAEEPEAKPEA